MNRENKSDLHKWIEEVNVNQDDEDAIRITLRAFSDYVTAIDSEYLYNKSFLEDFIEGFIQSNGVLYSKKEFIKDWITSLSDYQDEIEIDVDGVWIYKDHEIHMTNMFEKSAASSNKVRYQIKYIKNPTFVIAGETKLENKDEEVEKGVERFLSRLSRDEE